MAQRSPDPMDFLARLARPADTKIVLLILDGLGDLRTADQPRTALEAAATPHMDALAARSALGRITPVAPGVTPGSGPAHLALFGYDPVSPEADIGRGALEAAGMGIEFEPGDVVARGNFASADGDGNITDRRAGRIPTEEGQRLTEKINRALGEETWDGFRPSVHAGEAYRFVLLLEGRGLSPNIRDTDPQREGVPPKPLEAADPAAKDTIAHLTRVVEVMGRALADEPVANSFLLRGFASLPHLPSFEVLYRLQAGCFAGYPLYRGVSRVAGMEVVECGKSPAEVLDAAAAHWDRFDYLFLHVKGTDQAGEDGDLAAKIEVIEAVDRALPRLLDQEPHVLAITGDHSTPAPMAAHSWHPVPLLLHGPHCYMDRETRFDEDACTRGHLGTFPSRELMGLLLANAGRLKKYGA